MKTNIEILKDIIKKSPYGFLKTILGRKYKFLQDWIIKQTPLLSDPYFNWKTKIYWVLNDIHEFSKCEICGKDLKINVLNIVVGYKVKTCCKECRYKQMIKQSEQTCLEKYGVKSVMQTQEFKDRSKKSNLERYGVEYTSQIPGIAEKRKKTCLERYGVDVPIKSPEILAKSRQTQLERYGETSFTKTKAFIEKTNKTCRERYGTDFPSQSEHAKQVHRETCIEKYGVDSYSKTQEFQDKTRATWLEKYGVENVWQAGAEGREKSRKTRLERYGDENYNNRELAADTCIKRYGYKYLAQCPEISQSMSTGNLKNNYKKLLDNKHVVPLFSVGEYLAKTPDTVFKWKCLDCGNEFETKINWNYYKDHPLKTVARCLVCRPLGFSSTSEEEREFISEIRKLYSGPVLERQSILENGNDRRSWREIDCYLPDLKIGFEYDGIYFHQLSSFDDDSHKHIFKTELAEKQGIKLIHVRSDEWLDNRDECLKTYNDIINGTVCLSSIADINNDIIEVDRSIYNKCVEFPGYDLLGETAPEKFEFEHGRRKYIYEDCGKLIYRKAVK